MPVNIVRFGLAREFLSTKTMAQGWHNAWFVEFTAI